MDNNEVQRPPKNKKCEKLGARLRDLAGWVELEFGLPEDDQTPMLRLDAMVRSFLGDFTRRAAERARRDLQFKVMQQTAEACRA